jgi:hypothetical protein
VLDSQATDLMDWAILSVWDKSDDNESDDSDIGPPTEV